MTCRLWPSVLFFLWLDALLETYTQTSGALLLSDVKTNRIQAVQRNHSLCEEEEEEEEDDKESKNRSSR